MLRYNRTITRTNINVFLNTGPGTGERRKKKEAKKATFPTLVTMIVVFKAAVFLLGLVVSLDLLKADGG